MYSYNRIHLIGYQSQPVDVRQTPSGTSVTDLNLVVPYSFKGADGTMQNGKSFHTVTVWGGMADIAGQYVRPGSQLFIAGRLQTDSWEDTNTGEKKSKTKVVALDMTMLDPKDGQLQYPAGAATISSGVNTAQVVGNLTKDPEMRTTTSGQQVVSIGIATNDRWRDKSSGEDKERTEFHNVVLWGDLASEVSQHMKKGNRIYVSGRVQTRTWETQSGEKRYTTEIVAESVSMLGTANPTIADNVQTSSAPVHATQEQVPQAQPTQDAQQAKEAAAVAAVPEVQYASEVKVEDLPF